MFCDLISAVHILCMYPSNYKEHFNCDKLAHQRDRAITRDYQRRLLATSERCAVSQPLDKKLLQSSDKLATSSPSKATLQSTQSQGATAGTSASPSSDVANNTAATPIIQSDVASDSTSTSILQGLSPLKAKLPNTFVNMERQSHTNYTLSERQFQQLLKETSSGIAINNNTPKYKGNRRSNDVSFSENQSFDEFFQKFRSYCSSVAPNASETQMKSLLLTCADTNTGDFALILSPLVHGTQFSHWTFDRLIDHLKKIYNKEDNKQYITSVKCLSNEVNVQWMKENIAERINRINEHAQRIAKTFMSRNKVNALTNQILDVFGDTTLTEEVRNVKLAAIIEDAISQCLISISSLPKIKPNSGNELLEKYISNSGDFISELINIISKDLTTLNVGNPHLAEACNVVDVAAFKHVGNSRPSRGNASRGVGVTARQPTRAYQAYGRGTHNVSLSRGTGFDQSRSRNVTFGPQSKGERSVSMDGKRLSTHSPYANYTCHACGKRGHIRRDCSTRFRGRIIRGRSYRGNIRSYPRPFEVKYVEDVESPCEYVEYGEETFF